MAIVTFLTFNPFQENTYIVYDETGEAVIFDPGCSNDQEKNELLQTLDKLKVKPIRLINTHCNIDHILGNKFVAEHFNLPLEIHKGELGMLEKGAIVAARMPGSESHPSLGPAPGTFVTEKLSG